MYFTSCKNKPVRNEKGHAVNEIAIINQQKRALIIELIKMIINLQCDTVNDSIKPLLVHVYLQLTQIKQGKNKGIIVLLNLFGNPEDIVREI